MNLNRPTRYDQWDFPTLPGSRWIHHHANLDVVRVVPAVILVLSQHVALVFSINEAVNFRVQKLDMTTVSQSPTICEAALPFAGWQRGPSIRR
jgi:hypothetical protein